MATRALAAAVRNSGVPVHEIAWPLGLDARHVVLAEELDRLPVAELVLIADRVGFSLSKLFSSPSDARGPAASPEDVAVLGACLGGSAEGHARAVIARALGWDTARLEAAALQLHEQLAPLGLSVANDPEGMRIERVAGIVEADRLQTVARGSASNGPVDADVANVVWSALFLEERLRLVTNIVLTRAHREGLLAIGEDGDYHVADAVSFSLMLGDPASTG